MGDGLMTVHLGMTGDLLALEEGGELPSYARAVLEFDDGGLLAYDDPRKFGAIGLASSLRGFVMEHGLGPDALAIAGKQFIAKASRSARSLKSLLLDQHVLAGVGNLYADEALFRSRLYPLQPADSLDKAALGRLCGNVKRVLRASIGAGTDFSQLPGSYLLRERREGARCPRGNGELMVMRVGGRSSYYCPACQVLR
jgi:formamidopyrimidine-DNA glycosylase